MRRQVEVSKPKPKPKPFYQRKTKTMKLEVVATPPVGRHRRLANGSSSAGIAPVALTQPTPNSEEPNIAYRYAYIRRRTGMTKSGSVQPNRGRHFVRERDRNGPAIQGSAFEGREGLGPAVYGLLCDPTDYRPVAVLRSGVQTGRHIGNRGVTHGTGPVRPQYSYLGWSGRGAGRDDEVDIAPAGGHVQKGGEPGNAQGVGHPHGDVAQGRRKRRPSGS